MDYDSWKTSEPEECSFCGSAHHSRRYCADFKELEAEAAERKADEMRDARMLKRLHPGED